MYILTVNAGSSSIKLGLHDYKTLNEINHVHIEKLTDYEKAFSTALKLLNIEDKSEIRIVGHRVVHGGTDFKEATLITKPIEKKIEELAHLAPLHNPVNLKAIQIAKKLFRCPHFAVFDTAFFSTLPLKTKVYGIPYNYYEKDKIQKYGFHGTNHKYVYYEACNQINQSNASGIVCHLGNGCSISIIHKGKPLDTSMGFTPLEGLIMGTRAGSIDPSIIFYLQKKYGRLNVKNMLENKSGLLGLSGVSNHMREIYLSAKNDKNPQAKLAIDTFCYSVAKYIGFYSQLVENLDFIAFTGGIGERAGYVRNKSISMLPGLFCENILVVPANESYQIALESKDKLAKAD